MRNEMWNLPGMKAMMMAGLMLECESCGDPVLEEDARSGTIDGIDYEVLCQYCYDEFVKEE